MFLKTGCLVTLELNKGFSLGKGILVAADKNLEWLLPWWWERYIACNSLPVVFVDLGMSEEKKLWCEERGTVISLQDSFSEKPIAEDLYAKWKGCYGKSYDLARKAWFKKPAACLLSPFGQSLWLDLDCEVLDSVEPIFSYLQGEKEIAVALGDFAESGAVCNSGVLVFKKDSFLMQEWASRALLESEKHWGDDSLLSVILRLSMEKTAILPEIYNWRVSRGLPLHAKIIHWCGEWGKSCIKKHGGLKRAIVEANAK